MENNKVLEMFDSIPKFETYSKYSLSLHRIFKNNSLKHLIKDLKSPKKLNECGNEKNKKGLSQGKSYLNNINDMEDQMLIKVKENENEDFFDVKFDNKKKMKKNKSFKEIRKIIPKKKNVLPDYPDPYKYDPNYNSIYKNVPSVKFIIPINYIKKKKEKEELKVETLEKKKKKKHNKIPNTKPSIMLTEIEIQNTMPNLKRSGSTLNDNIYSHINLTTNTNENINNKNNTTINHTEGKLNKSKSQSKYKKLLPPITKENHALKFSQYTWRKFIIPKNIDKLTYLEPINYLENIKKVIDFNKMNPRSELINNPSNLDNPSICYYQPKYSFIEKNPFFVSFGNINENKKNKKFLLKKLWGSYNLTSDYQLVDNDKLNHVKN